MEEKNLNKHSQLIVEKTKQTHMFQKMLIENENGEPLKTARDLIFYNVLKAKFTYRIRLLELQIYDLCNEE